MIITTGCLLDFVYFERNYKLIDAGLSKLIDADPTAIQPILFSSKIKSAVANTRVIIYYIPEQSKEATLKFSNGTTKVL